MALLKSNKSVSSVSMVLVLLMALLGVSSATLYEVEWNENSIVNYKTWSSDNKFHVGDVIVFRYKAGEDSVVRVTHKDYRSCNATNPIAVFDSGEDSVTVKSTHAHLYFISGVAGRCEAGQKVHVRVSQPSAPHHHSGDSPAPAPGPEASAAAEPSGKALVVIELLMMAVGVLYY